MPLSKIEKTPVEIKGYGGELGLILDQDTSFQMIEQELHRLLEGRNKHFFSGSRIILRAGERTVSSEEYDHLKKILYERGNLQLCIPESAPPTTLDTAPLSGPNLEDRTIGNTSLVLEGISSLNQAFNDPQAFQDSANPSGISELFPPGTQVEESFVVHQTLRSGQTLSSPRTIVLFGDVNPGAEITSGHSVWVIGNLRGVVHAGAEGDEHAVVFGIKLHPVQLRIAHLQFSEEEPRKPRVAEMASIQRGRIVIENY